ncbi:MAG: hypothetical protein ACFFBD_10680, partial [Candidatus Hodarchaeota archaeon]
ELKDTRVALTVKDIREDPGIVTQSATKALKNAPDHYPELDIGKGVKKPRQILHHITGVLSYAHSFFEHYGTTYFEQKLWDDEVKHFYEILLKLDKSIQEKSPMKVSEEQLLQGPLSDAMAHIGQLLMLRRLADAPVSAENFIFADIKKGAVGPNQPEPVAPDD